jgi:hypothetical protein
MQPMSDTPETTMETIENKPDFKLQPICDTFETDAPESLAAWTNFVRDNNMGALIRHMISMERERDEAIAEATNAVNDIIRVRHERDEARRLLRTGAMQSVIVFGARYTHDRPTAGAHAVVRALRQCWHILPQHTREQIIYESHEASCNLEDWEELRKFDKKFIESSK